MSISFIITSRKKNFLFILFAATLRIQQPDCPFKTPTENRRHKPALTDLQLTSAPAFATRAAMSSLPCLAAQCRAVCDSKDRTVSRGVLLLGPTFLQHRYKMSQLSKTASDWLCEGGGQLCTEGGGPLEGRRDGFLPPNRA